jgi:ABC-type branched-subunit amino acid transport system ATPase component
MSDIAQRVTRVIALLDSLDDEACSELYRALSQTISEGPGNRLDVVYALCSLLATGLASIDEPSRGMLREDIPALIDVVAARRERDRMQREDAAP